MKALVLSLVIAFTSSFAFAACTGAPGNAHGKSGALTRANQTAPKTGSQSVANR